jgi:hypothetical protein
MRAEIVHLYGIDVRTPWLIEGLAPANRDGWDVEFVKGDPSTFAAASALVPAEQADWWAQSAALPDGSSYRRWARLFEFLVAPDARRIYARTFDDHTHDEALLAYLLVDALSHSMVRLGREPLHATAISTGRRAAAFLGASGDGKSTLAALFLQAGGRLVTDDMLVLTIAGDRYLAELGPPRIKLYRVIADRILGGSYHGVPMNAVTEKLIIPLDATRTVSEACPLDALYILQHGDDHATERPVTRRLSPAEALPSILAATAAHDPSDRDRLRRQFEFLTRLVQRVPVSALTYRRHPESMHDVRDAVLEDLDRLR